jgi:hypothetical protein
MCSEPFETLRRVHPDVAASVAARLAEHPAPAAPDLLDMLAAESLWALTIEASFGRAVAAGYAELVGAAAPAAVDTYRRWVREAGGVGATQGAIMAESLPPVLVHGDADLLRRFRRAWAALTGKGTYALRAPLEALGGLLKGGDTAAAAAYLDLLAEAFQRELTYEQARWLTGVLPRTALGLAPPRRCRQLAALGRVMGIDHRLVEPFLTGLSKGLGLLEGGALQTFVDAALRKHARHPEFTARCLALESRSSQEVFAGLQVRVGFAQVRDRLRRYLQARTGRPLAIRPFSALPELYSMTIEPERMVCSDGEAVYVPDEIDRFDSKEANLALVAALVRLEASFHEFGTIDFDLEKAVERYPGLRVLFDPAPGARPAEDWSAPDAAMMQRSDLDRFLDRFADRGLAGELFTVFELGRIRHCLRRHYPGLVRRAYPMLRATALEELRRRPAVTFCDGLMLRVALAVPQQEWNPAPAEIAEALKRMAAAFEADIRPDSPVEASAELTARFFEAARAVAVTGGGGGPAQRGLSPPFGWRPWPNPAADGATAFARQARRLKALFASAGRAVHAADLRPRLAASAGALTPADLRALFGDAGLDAMQLEELLRLANIEGAAPGEVPEDDRPAQRYPEWDLRLGDYLQDHVHLREQAPAPDGAGFYDEVLRRHGGLVRRTRSAFERLRPEGLKRLRRWADGDEFDYRELVAAWVDRRTGVLPSERLFVKRVKDRRDVAVLLLADLSRSTTNRVPGTGASVLDIEKEAIVVLCEALSILGDAFSVAGFSGSGRRGVDYFPIKDFAEPLSEAVRSRIGALAPQRNTRMGAAIRHAAIRLGAVPARVRLLIILSDGFPNDTGYKGPYAVADTRQALLELNARHIRFHALTVNLPADPKLDELYGRARHHVISEVRELPERLLRVYSALTR